MYRRSISVGSLSASPRKLPTTTRMADLRPQIVATGLVATVRGARSGLCGTLNREMSPADAKSLRAALIAQANASGGWAYYPGRSSRIEPTCWALLALGDERTEGFDPQPHWHFLLNCQRASGLLVEDPALPPNLAFNALAALALQRHTGLRASAALAALLYAVAGQSGLQVAQSPNFQQDNSLRGWPWIEGTFSWVEPTCWALIALKRAQTSGVAIDGAAQRVDEAERLLVDRCCREGGWNYGNANALGKDLFPYISVTALALLALRNRRDADAVTRSLRFLQDQWSTEESTISLGLTSICLRRFGIASDKVDQALVMRLPIASSLNNIHALAVALYAAADAATDDSLSV